MRRIQLIEIHDQSWFPGFLRDQVTDALQLILQIGNLYQPIAHRLRKALDLAGTRRILDLCSGAGGPWLWLYKSLDRQGTPPVSVCLTDKYPNTTAFNRAKIASRNKIDFHADPVDVTEVPAELVGFRTLFASFHHFRPQEARAIIQDAINRHQGIGIFEVPGRHAVTIVLVFLVPVADWLLTPFLRPFRWSRLLWTYVIPVIPVVLWFDGIVSCLRAYSPRELTELTVGLSFASAYEWDIGEEHAGFLSVPITYLIGCPRLAPGEASRSLKKRASHSVVRAAPDVPGIE